MMAEKQKIVRKTVTSSGKAVPCHACYRPCADKDDIYCQDCIESGDAKWHSDMLAKWRAEIEAKEES